MQAATDSSISVQGSQAVDFPEPHVNATTPSGPTTGFLTVPQGLDRVSGPFSTSSVTLHSVPTSTSGISEPDGVAASVQASAKPSGPTAGFSTVPQGPGRVLAPSLASSVTLYSVSTSTSGLSEPDSVAAQRQAICDAWTDAEGEIPVSLRVDHAELSTDLNQVLDKTDMSSWTPIFSAPLASKDRGDGDSWRDGLGALLNNYCT